MKISLTLIMLFIYFSNINAQNISSKFIDIDHDTNGNILNCGENIKRHISKEFILSDSIRKEYAIDITEDSSSYLLYKFDNKWCILDTIAKITTFYSLEDCTNDIPTFEITDFNEDGYPDFIATIFTNINGNLWSKIYLFDSKNEKLKLIRSSEDDGLWVNPEYNSKKRTIKCEEYASAYGVSYKSKYKLLGLDVIPIEEEIVDRTNMKYVMIRHFKGRNGHWVLEWEEKEK